MTLMVIGTVLVISGALVAHLAGATGMIYDSYGPKIDHYAYRATVAILSIGVAFFIAGVALEVTNA